MNTRNITRRNFLTAMGTGAAAVTATWLADGTVAPVHADGLGTEQSWSVLIDLTRCTGCGSCSRACQRSHGSAVTTRVPSRLDEDVYTCLTVHQVTTANDIRETLYVKHQCMHCVHPACVSACTVGALRKTPAGPVIYDAAKCIGCRYCQYACPFGVPTYDWQDPLGLISKCQFCHARLSASLKPACVEACPTGALRFGQRDALLAQAHAQIVTNPDRYVDHIYGEQEAGGTLMLYLSPVPFNELDFPLLDSQPIPHHAEAVMKLTPVVAVTVASAVTGLNWILKRRDHKLAGIQGERK